METENYKIVANSQKIATEINKSTKDLEEKSSVIEELAISKPELIRELYDRLNDRERVAEIANIIDNIDSKRNVEHLLEAIDRKNRSRRIFKMLKIASSAAAVLILSLMTWFTLYENETTQHNTSEIKNGSSTNPVLKLSSGKVYELVADMDKVTRDDINYIVGQNSKIDVSDLKKEIYGDSTIKGDDVLRFELSVPKKSIYTLVLSDSSEVILNANSSIYYPEKFTSDKREVTIKGEVFFNVRKSKIPFVVNIGNSYVKVYGTSFNINARNEKMVKTTLVSGVVGVGATHMAEKILKPNQIAVVNTDRGECQISDIDSENATGWMMGSIISINNSLESLINDLETWYGVDIRYDKHSDIIKNTKMNILIKHTMEIDEALKLIEKVTNVKFINEGGYYSIKIN